MANEIQNAIKATMESISKYVEQVATLTVETRYLDVTAQTVTFDVAKPVARTDISLTGDCTTILPGHPNETGAMAVDAVMFQLHQQSVATAIEYRARMLTALLGGIRQFGINLPNIPNLSPTVPSTFPSQTTTSSPSTTTNLPPG